MKWDIRFIVLAKHVASWSKDPSTKVGAVIVRPDRTVASVGYNGFPRGCDDSPELYANRDEKIGRVVHAERNAILSAYERLHGYTVYCTFAPCDGCAGEIIQAGIRRVVAPVTPDALMQRWGVSLTRAATMFAEAGVQFDQI